ncbi:hypothetical protein N9C11_05590 [Flavobacteriaceae bacterium]|nr:hypothetical protein [Flavobacteriaceae bacterium]
MKIPVQSVLNISSGEVHNLNDYYSTRLNYKTLNDEFNSFIKKSPLFQNEDFIHQNNNLSTIFYRDYYQLFYTKKQYNALFNLIESGNKIIVSTGDPYLRRILVSYIKNGYKNVKIYKINLFNITTLISDILKLFLNLITIIRHPFFLFKKNKCLVHTSNNFGPNTKYDYRIASIIKKIDENRIPMLFLIRTTHLPNKILINHFRRDHICLYTDSIIKLANFYGVFKTYFSKKKKYNFDKIIFEKLKHGLQPIICSINTLKFLLKTLKSNTFFISDNSERSIIELIAANQLKLNTIGIQMGIELYYYHGHKFTHGLSERANHMSHEKFGVWSEGWKEYFIKYSKVFKPKNIYVSGFHRNVVKKEKVIIKKTKVKKVLWLCENLTPVKEIISYVQHLVDSDFDLYIKARPQQKDAGDQIADELIKYFGNDKFTVITNPIENCATDYDVAIGSYTTAILDCGLMGVPVLLIKNKTWEDVFDLQKDILINKIYCKSGIDLLSKLDNLPIESIRLFIDQYSPQYSLNGSNWVYNEVNKSFVNFKYKNY